MPFLPPPTAPIQPNPWITAASGIVDKIPGLIQMYQQNKMHQSNYESEAALRNASIAKDKAETIRTMQGIEMDRGKHTQDMAAGDIKNQDAAMEHASNLVLHGGGLLTNLADNYEKDQAGIIGGLSPDDPQFHEAMTGLRNHYQALYQGHIHTMAPEFEKAGLAIPFTGDQADPNGVPPMFDSAKARALGEQARQTAFALSPSLKEKATRILELEGQIAKASAEGDAARGREKETERANRVREFQKTIDQKEASGQHKVENDAKRAQLAIELHAALGVDEHGVPIYTEDLEGNKTLRMVNAATGEEQFSHTVTRPQTVVGTDGRSIVIPGKSVYKANPKVVDAHDAKMRALGDARNIHHEMMRQYGGADDTAAAPAPPPAPAPGGASKWTPGPDPVAPPSPPAPASPFSRVAHEIATAKAAIAAGKDVSAVMARFASRGYNPALLK
jgi:hypothetical protein